MKRVILIGLDGASWASLQMSMTAGCAPFVSGLVSRGTLLPVDSDWAFGGPTPWITLATGRPAGVHGVLWPDEAWAGGIRPVSQASWRVEPVWNRLEVAGKSTCSVAWPGSRSGMNWPGLHIDESYPRTYGQPSTAWSLPRSCCPSSYREELRGIRVHPTDLIGRQLPVLAWEALHSSDAANSNAIERATAEALSIEAAAQWAIRNNRCDATFIYFGWLASIYALLERRAAADRDVITGAWQFLDAILDKVAQQIDPDAHLLLVSSGTANNAGFIASWHCYTLSDDTVSLRLIDIAPTILALLGFEAHDLSGRSIAAIEKGSSRTSLSAKPPVAALTSRRADFLTEVVRHGYSEPLPPPAKWRAQRLARLAALCIQQSPKDALKLTDDALNLLPDDVDILDLQATALVALRQAARLSLVADRIDHLAPGDPRGVLAQTATSMLVGDIGTAASLLPAVEKTNELSILLRAGGLWLLLRRPEDAKRVFRLALLIEAQCVDAEIGLSESALMQDRPDEAALAARRVLERDPIHQPALTQLQRALRRTKGAR